MNQDQLCPSWPTLELLGYHVVSVEFYMGKQGQRYLSHHSFGVTTAHRKDFNFVSSDAEENTL